MQTRLEVAAGVRSEHEMMTLILDFARNHEELLFGAFIICVLLAVITLIQTIYRLVVGPPDVAETKAWEFLICLICTGVMWFVNE